MALIEWSDVYSVNNSKLDSHHKTLIDHINSLYKAKQTRCDKFIIGSLLKDLVAYMDMHFTKEEELLKKYSYPEFEAHRAKHESLAEKVLEFKKAHGVGWGVEHISESLAIFLNKWLFDHIAVEDKKYIPYINGKNNK